MGVFKYKDEDYFVFEGSGSGQAVLISKNITTNGTYNALSDNANGYAQVNVNVPQTDLSPITLSSGSQLMSGIVGMNSSGSLITGTIVNRGALDTGDLSGEQMQAGYYSATNIGTAARGEVLNGKTFTSTAGIRTTGTMTNRGAWTGSANPSNGGSTNVTIPAGYHNGSGYVTANGQNSYNNGYTSGYSAGRNAYQASRVALWTGSVRSNVSVSLSGYSWIYITVADSSRPSLTYPGSAILQVGGSSQSAGIIRPIDGSYRSYCTYFQAVSTGVNALTPWAYDNEGTLYLTGIYGIKNLS